MMHLGIARLLGVLGRGRRRDDPRFREDRIDNRAGGERRPGHHPLHRAQKHRPPRRPRLAFKPHRRQAQLLHAPTLACLPPIRTTPSSPPADGFCRVSLDAVGAAYQARAGPCRRAGVDRSGPDPDPGHRHVFRRALRRPCRAGWRAFAAQSGSAGSVQMGELVFDGLKVIDCSQLHRRPGGGDGHVGFRRRGDQDRAAGGGRPLSPAGTAADRAGARGQPRLCPRRPQQEEPGARSAPTGRSRGAVSPGRRGRRVHHQLSAAGAPPPRHHL